MCRFHITPKYHPILVKNNFNTQAIYIWCFPFHYSALIRITDELVFMTGYLIFTNGNIKFSWNCFIKNTNWLWIKKTNKLFYAYIIITRFPCLLRYELRETIIIYFVIILHLTKYYIPHFLSNVTKLSHLLIVFPRNILLFIYLFLYNMTYISCSI